MLGSEVASVKSYRDALKQLLKKARDVKPGGAIEPALTSGDLGGDIESLGKGSGSSFITKPLSHYAAIETACRDIFYDLVVSAYRILCGDSSLIIVGCNLGR